MDSELMLIPMFGMVCLTFAVGVTMRLRREKAVKEGFDWRYYKTFEGVPPPRFSLQADQHFSNMFEVPMLFYAACITAMVLDSVDQISLALALFYLIGRLAHARIALTHNRLQIRARVYVASGLILFALWAWIFTATLLI